MDISLTDKMVVLDLDRTLLRSDQTLSDYSKSVLCAFAKKGGKVVVATGRPAGRADSYCKEIKACGLVALNGSITYLHDEIIDQTPIDEGLIYKLIGQILSIGNVELLVAYPTCSITNKMEYVLPGICEFTDFKEFDLQGIQKINVITKCVEELLEIDYDEANCKILKNDNDPYYFVITQKDVNKFNGIRSICEKEGIRLENVIAFGDDYNDIEMLRYSGKGVAVENAPEEIKGIADTICKSNDEDGPAEWIHSFFNLNIG